MAYHHPSAKRTLLQKLGLGRSDSLTSNASFHDLDELKASPLAEFRRPWWVRSVEHPTVDIDWQRLQRFDARKVMQVSFDQYIGNAEYERLLKESSKKTKAWILENKDGYTLPDRALNISGRSGSADVTFMGPGSQSKSLKDTWVREVLNPDKLGVPVYEGRADENSRMIRAALRYFGADQVGFVELNEQTRKLIYAYDCRDGKAIEFENVETAYETRQKRVIPYKAKWVIVFTVLMSGELLKRTIDAAPTAMSSSATGLAYSRARNIIERLQTFLHVLGYQGLMGTWYNGLGIAPAFGVLAGLGELGRINRLISPEYGPIQRVFKVVTDLPLEPTKPINAGIMQFCKTCKKCAEVCPSGALSMDTNPTWETKGPWNNPGVRTYFDDGIKCRTYWETSTASCARCLIICPFSAMNKSFIHKIVKGTLSQTPLFNRFFTEMHTFFGYDRPKRPESWWNLNQPPYGVDTMRATQLWNMVENERKMHSSP